MKSAWEKLNQLKLKHIFAENTGDKIKKQSNNTVTPINSTKTCNETNE